MTHFSDKQINNSFTPEQVEAIKYVLSYFNYKPGTKRFYEYRDMLALHTANKADTVINMATARGFTYDK